MLPAGKPVVGARGAAHTGPSGSRKSTAWIKSASPWTPMSCVGVVAAAGRLSGRQARCRSQRSLPRRSRMYLRSLTTEKERLTLSTLATSTDFRITDAIIDRLSDDDLFEKLAIFEEDLLIKRDDQDAELLKAGIQKGIDEGALVAPGQKPVYEDIDVTKMEANERAHYMATQLPAATEGFVVILVGKSGTGKETTFKKLQQELPEAIPWSNGNCFRALTLLAVTHCEQQGKDFEPECLTPQNLEAWVGMLQVVLEEGSDTIDIRIKGLGFDKLVSEIKDTILKDPPVSRLLPVVAKSTQAQVVAFAQQALQQAAASGRVVLLEGREETLDFIPSNYRFRLTLPDSCNLLRGQRRAAQRILGEAKEILSKTDGDSVDAVLNEALQTVAKGRDIQ
ncbi:hypothetical protein AK812_SmicGene43593 [Symbiodinium microadriaticum]|uniref:Uncharacterized protein n=1 Tax=Symbiodinium microadriaticum TaxID=2951 RepID=A0A1Q9C0L4_SYMMI|nr:hypothetical protein AK812_SmicGene43593 [Symbiodinium microadriaticum]CAE7241197.1 unnamed protein product [Symbiodinium microadriaticum]CAE7948518.1 unnamed protein product [Symbiodinium sp. KB8]